MTERRIVIAVDVDVVVIIVDVDSNDPADSISSNVNPDDDDDHHHQQHHDRYDERYRQHSHRSTTG